MKNTHKFMPDGPSDRFWLIHDSIVRYCERMWANIISLRSRAMEHIVVTASIVGIYLGVDAASDYDIGLWGFAGIMCLLAFALPHLLLTIHLTDVPEFYLGPEHLDRPKGESEAKVLMALDKVATLLRGEASLMARQYRFARNSYWMVGIPIEVALVVLDWVL